MPYGARWAACRFLAGLSLLVPVLGCCAGPGSGIVCRDGPAEAVGYCARCGRPHRVCGSARCRPACSECEFVAGPCEVCGRHCVAPVRGALAAVRAQCQCMFCRLRGLVMGLHGAGDAVGAPERDSPFPRFHPVPKRPALSPAWAGCGTAPERLEPEAGPREPERVPTPTPAPAPLPEPAHPAAPKPTDGWKPMQRKAPQAAAASPWMFRPVRAGRSAIGPEWSAVSSQPSALSLQQSVGGDRQSALGD